MTINDIARHRLFSQHLTGVRFTQPKEIVSHLGAMQAQDYGMAKWAIGVRLSTDEKTIEDAINSGQIIRTHILRQTWHFVSADDIRWMLSLTAPHIKRALASMCKNVQLDATTLTKCKSIIQQSLRDGNFLTREEIMARLNKENIATNDIRSAFIMFDAELDGIVCNGPMRQSKFTYALLDERVPAGKILTRSEGLAELAKRYFTSHGPATVYDFAWWSGLTVTDAKLAVELVKESFHSDTILRKVYWFDEISSDKNDASKAILFLPAYDEYLVSYKDRSASLETSFTKETISVNGIFKPVIVVNGKVVGLWKRTLKKDTIEIEPYFFSPTKKLPKRGFDKVAAHYANFKGMKTIVQ